MAKRGESKASEKPLKDKKPSASKGGAGKAPRAKRQAAAEAPRPKASALWRIIRTSMVLLLVLVLAGGLGVAGMFYVYSLDMPRILAREDFRPKQMSRIYSSEGHVIDELVADEGRRTVVPFEHIAKPMRDAIMAAEDADFYQHQGLDYMGMVRALYYAVRYNKRQGASTITQQVVKNLILTPEKKLKRKVQEIMLARALEQNLSKDDILYIYLNQIYFGHGNYGVQEASRYFFGKDASALSVAEAASLAGLVQSPERYSPLRHPERTRARRTYVLKQMRDKGMIDEATWSAANSSPLKIVKDRREVDPWMDTAPYYTAEVLRELERRFVGKEVAAMGLNVRTGLVVDKQVAADKAVRDGLHDFDASHKLTRAKLSLKGKALEQHHDRMARKIASVGLSPGTVYEAVVTAVKAEALELRLGTARGTLAAPSGSRTNADSGKLGQLFSIGDVVGVMVVRSWTADAPDVAFVGEPLPQAALVSIDVKTRRVEALVGGYDFAESSYNRATQAHRQTGSSFKPVVYATALADRVSTPATIWLDAPKPFQLPEGTVWNPKNSDGKYLGPLRLRRALALSRNVVAVRLLEKVGIGRAQEVARQLGIESSLVDNYTMALGSSELTVLEMANAYTTLAGQGERSAPIFITSVDDSFAQELFRAEATREQTLPPEVAWLTTQLMTSVLQGGTASKVGRAFKRPAAGKTGTTNKSVDAWFVGFTPQKVTAVWVGYDDNRPLGKRAAGGTTAAPIWLSYMQAAHKDLPKEDFPKPAMGIVEARIDPKTGLLAPVGSAGGFTEYFLTGTAPTEYAPEDGESSAGDFLLNQGGDGDEAAEGEAEE